jgi:poly-D-alanine transfer protein DltD
MHNNTIGNDKTLMKSASRTKAGLLKGTSIQQNVYSDKNFLVMNENRGPVMITA